MKMGDHCEHGRMGGGMGGGMGMMGMGDGGGKKMDCSCMRGKERGMGMMGGMGGMSGMGGMGMMGGMKDDATAARLQSLEKRIDMLQDMMKMMMR